LQGTKILFYVFFSEAIVDIKKSLPWLLPVSLGVGVGCSTNEPIVWLIKRG